MRIIGDASRHRGRLRRCRHRYGRCRRKISDRANTRSRDQRHGGRPGGGQTDTRAPNSLAPSRARRPEAIAEAKLAIANPNDAEALAVDRAHVQQARINIMLREGDPGISAEQRTATADLNRQLQRLLISVDAARRE